VSPANNPAEVEALMADGWDDAVLTGRRLSGRPITP